MNRLDSMKRVMDSTNRSYISGTHELADVYKEMFDFANQMGKAKNIEGYFFGIEYMKDSKINYPNLQPTEYYNKQLEEVLQFSNTLTQGRVM